MNYHGVRYLEVSQFTSYCKELKVDVDPFHHDLELYEKEGAIYPAARVIKPKEYILERKQFERIPEHIYKRMPGWEDFETLLFGNRNIAWHDFDLAIQNGNKYIVQPKRSNFQSWDSYRVEVEAASGEEYLVESATHYYHYWQVYQIYELQKKYPIFSKNNWVYQIVKENNSARADYLFPGNPAPLANFYGRYKSFEALSVFIHLYHYEHKKMSYERHRVSQLSTSENEQLSAKMKEYVILVLQQYGLELDELFSFIPNLLSLERDYRDQEKYLLAGEVKKDITWLINMISYASDKTFDDIQGYLTDRVPRWDLQRLRHLSSSLLVNDMAKDDLKYLLKEYNDLFSGFSLDNKEVEDFVNYLEKNQISIIPFSIYYLVDVMNQSEPVWFTSLFMGLSGLLVGLESFLRKLYSKSDLYNLLITVIKEEWRTEFEENKKRLEMNHNKDNILIIFELVNDDKITNEVRIFLTTYFFRNLVFHRYMSEPEFYDKLYPPIYKSIGFTLLYIWSCSSKAGLV